MIGTIDTNIWLYGFDLKNPGNKNIRKWMKENLHKLTLNLSIIIPLELIHNLTKDPIIDFEIPLSYVNDIIMLENVHIINLDLLQYRNISNNLVKLRDLGIGGRDTAILSAIKKGEILITHDKNLLMATSYKRIDPYFDPPLILGIDEIFDADEFKVSLSNLD